MSKRIAVPVAGSSSKELRAIPVSADEEAVERARQGDVRAWDLIVRRHQEAVFRVVCLLVGDPVAAAATTESTFLRGYRALPDVVHGTPIRAWLIGIASSVSRAQRRSIERWYERDTRPFPMAGRAPVAMRGPGWEQVAALHPDVRDELRSAFERLTWDERVAVAARYLIGATRSEAAAIIGTEPEGVQRALSASLRHLRGALSDPGLVALSPDQLGWLATITIVGHFSVAPNVAPKVTDRLLRDAITYPEQFGPARRMAASRT